MKSLTIEQKYSLSDQCRAGYVFIVTSLLAIIVALANPFMWFIAAPMMVLSILAAMYHEWSRRKYAVEFAKIEVQDAYEKYISALRHEKKLLEGRAEYLENLEQFLNGVTP